MKTKLIFLISIAFVLNINAQKVEVKDSEEKIEDIKRTGLYITLELDQNDVEKEWQKKIKEYGKVKSSKESYYIAEATIPEISSTIVRMISYVSKTKLGTKVWYAIDLGNEYININGKDQSKYRAAVKLLHDFGVQQYINDINDQISDSEKVLEKTVKEQEKTIKKGDNINSDIQSNKDDNVKLKQKIADNESNLIKLNSNKDQNTLDQKKATDDVEKMKKAVEAVKSKLTKVN